MNKLQKADIELDEISKKISFYAVNRNNIEEEFQKVMDNPDYNPQFKYDPYVQDLDALRQRISFVETDDSTVGKILEDIKVHYLKRIDMIENRGNAKEFSNISSELYGTPDVELVEAAKELMSAESQSDDMIYSSKEAIMKFKIAFLKYGFPWEVKEKDMAANAAVHVAGKKIFVKRGARFSERFIRRLIVHEVGTHVARAENGESQPYLFFKRGIPGYLPTEEGLAVYNEEINDCLNPYILKVYAARVIAVDMALNKSFAEVYSYLREYFSDDTAFRITMRVKRGLEDTSIPGACTKDMAYFKGYQDVKKYMADGGDIEKLFYGKIGVDHVDMVESIKGLSSPNFIQAFRHINYLSYYMTNMVKFSLNPFLYYKAKKNKNKEIVF